MVRVEQTVQGFGEKPTGFAKVEADAGQLRKEVAADALVVVDADDRDLFGDGQADVTAGVVKLGRQRVVGNKYCAGDGQLPEPGAETPAKSGRHRWTGRESEGREAQRAKMPCRKLGNALFGVPGITGESGGVELASGFN